MTSLPFSYASLLNQSLITGLVKIFNIPNYYKLTQIRVQSRRAEKHTSTWPKSAIRRMESLGPETKPRVTDLDRMRSNEVVLEDDHQIQCPITPEDVKVNTTGLCQNIILHKNIAI